MGENGFKKQSKKPLVIVCLCLLAVVAGGAAFWLTREDTDPLALDDNATMGVLPGIDITERQAQLQEQLDESMIAFSINTSPVFATGGSEGNLMLESPRPSPREPTSRTPCWIRCWSLENTRPRPTSKPIGRTTAPSSGRRAPQSRLRCSVELGHTSRI